MITAEFCTRCKRAIGSDEQAHLKNGDVVCPDCAKPRRTPTPGTCGACGNSPGPVAYRVDDVLTCQKCFIAMHPEDTDQRMMPTAPAADIYVRQLCPNSKCCIYFYVSLADVDRVGVVCPKCGTPVSKKTGVNVQIECLLSIRLVLWLMFWLWIVGAIIMAIAAGNSGSASYRY